MTTTNAILTLLVASVLFSMLLGIIRAAVWAVGRARRGEPLLPNAPKRSIPPWGLGSVVLVILAWFVFSAGVSALYTSLTGGDRTTVADPRGGPSRTVPREFGFAEVMLVVTLVNGGLLLTVPVLLRLSSGARLSDLGFEPRGLARQAGVGAVGFLLISPFVYAFNGLAVLLWKPTPHALERMVRSDPSVGIAQLAILSAVLLAPAAEELIFRGVLQSWLYEFFRRALLAKPPAAHPEWLPEALDLQTVPEMVDPSEPAPFVPPAFDNLVGPSWLRLERAEILAILLTSALFGVVHLPQWPAPLAIFILSLGLGLVYRRTGSLVSSIVMHALFNGLGTLLLFWALQQGDVLAKNAKVPASCVVSGERLGAFPQRP